MTKQNGYRVALVAAMGMLVISQAQGAGYVLLDGGASYANLSTKRFDQAATDWRASSTATGARVSDDDRDTLWRLGAGYAWNDYWAVELFYENLGEYSGSMTLEGTGSQGASATLDATETVELSGFGAHLVGQWPLNDRFSMQGTAGLSYLENEREYHAEVNNFNTSVDSGSQSDDSREWVPTLGLGASFALTEQLDLRGRYTRYFEAGETDNLPSFDVDTVSAGFTWRW
ncbi:TonB-dependent receptor domain-containing protein [Vreelandella massiliensis]|uniref:TonB-dependent receptor domain-containing protein n=1 Tax=Vreelandella massiliensis TaxID=1816686 RepID=UPI00096A3743|nr:TonB-dependent receptor [Halomonas massiliensis]